MLNRIHSALSRVTSSGAFIPEIDGLRTVAILAVVTYHMHDWFFTTPAKPFFEPGGDVVGWVVFSGFFGVQLFFVISGFVLALPFAQHEIAGGRSVKLTKYYWRRVTRLQPPYVISLVAALIGAIWFGTNAAQNIGAYFQHFVAHVFYLHGALFGTFGTPGYYSLNNVTWSLEVEVQFYIIAPFLAQVYRIRSHELRRIVLVLAIVLSHLVMFVIPRSALAVTVVPFLYYFLLGFLLVDIYIIDWKNAQPTQSRWWDITGIAVWCALPFLIGQGHSTDLYVLLAILVAYVSAFKGVMLSRFFRNRWIVAIGGMCYTIYLYHTMLMWPIREVWTATKLGLQPGSPLPLIAIQMVITCLFVIAISAVLFVTFEKPFMKSFNASRHQGDHQGDLQKDHLHHPGTTSDRS